MRPDLTLESNILVLNCLNLVDGSLLSRASASFFSSDDSVYHLLSDMQEHHVAVMFAKILNQRLA